LAIEKSVKAATGAACWTSRWTHANSTPTR